MQDFRDHPVGSVGQPNQISTAEISMLGGSGRTVPMQNPPSLSIVKSSDGNMNHVKCNKCQNLSKCSKLVGDVLAYGSLYDQEQEKYFKKLRSLRNSAAEYRALSYSSASCSLYGAASANSSYGQYQAEARRCDEEADRLVGPSVLTSSPKEFLCCACKGLEYEKRCSECTHIVIGDEKYDVNAF